VNRCQRDAAPCDQAVKSRTGAEFICPAFINIGNLIKIDTGQVYIERVILLPTAVPLSESGQGHRLLIRFRPHG